MNACCSWKTQGIHIVLKIWLTSKKRRIAHLAAYQNNSEDLQCCNTHK